MKPRLKLLNNGTLTIVCAGSSGMDLAQTRQFVCGHYGTLKRFADTFHVPYWSICLALSNDHFAARSAGRVAHARKILGLRSESTAQAMSVAAAKGQRA